MHERFELVRPPVLVPLMEHVIDDVHPRRQIVGKRIGYVQLPKTGEVASTVRVQIPLGVRHDDRWDEDTLTAALQRAAR